MIFLSLCLIFLSAFFAPKQDEITAIMEKSPAEIRRYGRKLFKEIKTAAEDVYRGTPEKVNEVLGKTMDFLRLSLEIQDVDLQDHDFSISLSSSIERWGRRFGRYSMLREENRDFVKGNIQSFLASQSSLYLQS